MLIAEQNEITAQWYQRATVRYTPRIIVPDYSDEELIYPLARCAVCEHPLVLERGQATRAFILAQAAYQFLYGVGLLETKFVIQCSLDLLHNQIPGIGEFDKLQALTVIIDEGYHAHVALDYIMQMQHQSGITPLQVPESNHKLDAAARASATLPPAMRPDFQLLAVTLAENVLTEEIATLGRDKGLAQTFTTLMMDHTRDEGRHSGYFADLMKKRWTQLPQATRDQFTQMMPDYLEDFLGTDTTRQFERRILRACKFTPQQIEQIIAESESEFIDLHRQLTQKTRIRLDRLLKQIGVREPDTNTTATAHASDAA
ncbi:diiron oxygenase [Chitiniphilus eburneus]|uniref:Diiron oxygenase n=1 Tax=Chitiniphilus eburneus TaxID=2571148 RepID=A0A4U0PHK0_9NEIS|nr:diiron oxygenase [Chitiniphilus eburneus]TJZ67433.1 diiron oxygenase [Chitiniphilus eburneus]